MFFSSWVFFFFFSLKTVVCGYSITAAALLFFQLFHNHDKERPANIDQEKKSVQALVG